MNENRLPDYLDHIQQAATDVCAFVESLGKDDFLADKRIQQTVIITLPAKLITRAWLTTVANQEQ